MTSNNSMPRIGSGAVPIAPTSGIPMRDAPGADQQMSKSTPHIDPFHSLAGLFHPHRTQDEAHTAPGHLNPIMPAFGEPRKSSEEFLNSLRHRLAIPIATRSHITSSGSEYGADEDDQAEDGEHIHLSRSAPESSSLSASAMASSSSDAGEHRSGSLSTWLHETEERFVENFTRVLTPVEDMMLEGGFTV